MVAYMFATQMEEYEVIEFKNVIQKLKERIFKNLIKMEMGF